MIIKKCFSYYLLILTSICTNCGANYRHYHLDNADICSSGSRSLPGSLVVSADDSVSGNKNPRKGPILIMGSGSSIFKLDKPSLSVQPNYHNKATKCEIHVRAPKDHGIMAYVESMHMRLQNGSSSKCLDYVQFGQDDLVPFITLKKSNRLCGTISGFTYDDPNGDLLIWVNLGGRRSTSMWPHISVVNLTLIVTVYKANCKTPDQNQIKCHDSDRCIWKRYACDRHLNCPKDRVPADEDGCTYEHLTDNDGGGVKNGEDENSKGIESTSNVVSFILLVLSSILGILLLSVIIVRYKQTCCFKNSDITGTTAHGSCDFPEQSAVFSLQELSSSNRRTEENLYLPLSNFLQQQQRQQQPNSGGGVGDTVIRVDDYHDDEGPPPAYEDLFPPDPNEGQQLSGADNNDNVVEAERNEAI